MDVKEAIEQIKWYFEEDDGSAADKKTKQAYAKIIKVAEVAEQVYDQIKSELNDSHKTIIYSEFIESGVKRVSNMIEERLKEVNING